MDNLTNGILSVVKAAVEEYTLHIANKYELDISELEGYWNKVCGDLTISVKTNSATKKQTKKTQNKEEVKRCLYVFLKGAKRGKACNAKARTDGGFCSKHKHKEGVPQKEVKGEVLPKARKTVINKKITLRLHQALKKFWHPESKLVFKGKEPKDRVVIGRVGEDGDIQTLREEDIEECKKLSFKYEIKEEENNLKEKFKNLQIEEKNIEEKNIEDVLDDIIEVEEFSDISEEED